MRGSSSAWRSLLVGAGVLIFVGGAMHGEPSGPDLPLRENLASTMAAGGWVLGHSIMTAGALLLAAGVWLGRRGGSWPVSDVLLRVVVVGAVANLAELVVHTAVIVDEDRLRAGETGVLTAVHLVGLSVVYPLYGLTVAVLALRLAATWPWPVRAIGAVGVVRGLCHAVSAPLAIVTEDSSYEFLFPLAGIAVSAWWIGLGAYGVNRSDRPLGATVPAPVG